MKCLSHRVLENAIASIRILLAAKKNSVDWLKI
jgi:hypothetical protein